MTPASSEDDGGIDLRDGRRLSFRDLGPRDGWPVLFSHGLPSCRLAAELWRPATSAAGVRLIALDRPGLGASDPAPQRTIQDSVVDALELADRLALDRFSVLSVSSGLPYALAIVAAAPERVAGAALVSGLGRLDQPTRGANRRRESRVLYRLARRGPRLGAVWLSATAVAAARAPERVAKAQLRYMSAPDREVLQRPAVWALRTADLRESSRQGPQAAGHEARLHVAPWPFEFGEICRPVYIWQGTEDHSHPVGMAEWHATVIPESQLEVVEGVGGLGFVDHQAEILERLLSLAV